MSTTNHPPLAVKRKCTDNAQSRLQFHSSVQQNERKSEEKLGQIRIGTKAYGGPDPSFPGFEPIICLTKSTAYGALGPYCLRDENGALIENAWQATKVVKHTKKSIQKFPRSNRVIWEWPAERHVDDNGVLLPAWFKWHNALCRAEEPVRYPLTFQGRHETLGCYSEKHCKSTHVSDLLGIADSRKLIYFPKYLAAVKKHELYKKLLDKLRRGINLLIVDVDGPREESLDYYKKKYNVGNDFIVKNTILATEQNLKIMMNDPKHSCGHTYGLAAALLGLEKSFLELDDASPVHKKTKIAEEKSTSSILSKPAELDSEFMLSENDIATLDQIETNYKNDKLKKEDSDCMLVQ